MAETLIFHYQKGESFLHRQNVPVKLAALFCVSLLLLPVSLYRLILILSLLLLAHRASLRKAGPLLPFIRESLFFLIMGGIIFLSNFLSSGSLTAGILKAVRFYAILWAALLLTYTTDPLSISAGIYSLIKPLPLLPARQISTTMGLSLTMIPLILDQIREIREAMWSRCGMKPHRPIRNMIRLGLPLMEGILVKAEELSDAMESRLYTENATPPPSQKDRGWLLVLILLFCFSAGILIPEQLLSDLHKNKLFFRHY